MLGHSVTTGVTQYTGKYIQVGSGTIRVKFTMTDIEGYGADKFSRDILRGQLIEALRFERELNCLIIAVSFERFRNGLKEDLIHLMGIIKTLGLQHENTILCFTHCESYTLEVRETYKKEFLAYHQDSFSGIKEEDIMFCCFANISEINEDYRPIIVEGIKKSIETLREKI